MSSTNFDKTVHPLNQTLREKLQQKIDSKTKPIGALGQLEEIALQLGLIQESLTPQLQVPTIVLFAGDHGIVAEGVSPYPQDVTYQMVYNFLAGGAAINVFAEQHGIQMVIVDAGVNHDFPADADLIQAKIAYGTANALHEPAMSDTQRDQALAAGATAVTSSALAKWVLATPPHLLCS